MFVQLPANECAPEPPSTVPAFENAPVNDSAEEFGVSLPAAATRVWPVTLRALSFAPSLVLNMPLVIVKFSPTARSTPEAGLNTSAASASIVRL